MTSPIADFHIRRSLHANQLMLHRGEPSTLVLDELGLCEGAARVDVAVINGALNGYEIKSDRDTLERLPRQVEIYSKVLDTVVLITGPRHAKRIIQIVPVWWGIIAANRNDSEVLFEVIREPELNSSCSPYAIAQLLWRDEAIKLLEKKQLHRGLKSKPRQILWQVLAKELPLMCLKDAVRAILKARRNWRNGLPDNKTSSSKIIYAG
jgi:hypothetical protein